MRGTTRYILRQIFGPMLLISVTLFGVIWLTQSLRFIDKMVNEGLTFQLLLYLNALLLPQVLLLILPLALFCALIYAYNRLSVESELVVMWAAGLSTREVARPALILAAALTLFCYTLTLYFIPLGTRGFKDLQVDFRSNLANVLLQEGVFNAVAPGLTVYIRSRQNNGELAGILVHDNRDTARPVTMMAERGMLVRTAEGPRFVMVNGNRQQIDSDRNQLSLLYFDSYTLDLNAFTKPQGNRWLEPSERFLPGLFRPGSNAEDVEHYWKLIVEGHRRLTAPLHVLALTVIALAAILAGEFSRRGRSRRIAAAASAAVVLQLASLGMAHASVKVHLLIPLLYLLPIGFTVGAGLVLFGSLPRRRSAAVVGAT